MTMWIINKEKAADARTSQATGGTKPSFEPPAASLASVFLASPWRPTPRSPLERRRATLRFGENR